MSSEKNEPLRIVSDGADLRGTFPKIENENGYRYFVIKENNEHFVTKSEYIATKEW